jgi:hypothetical protein
MSKTLLIVLAFVVLVVVGLRLHYSAEVSVETLVERVRDTGSYATLEKLVTSANHKDRLRALHASLILQTDEAFRFLQQLTADRTVLVRVALVSRLDSLPETHALPLILKLLDDPHPAVARDAVLALQHFTGKDYGLPPDPSPEDRARVLSRCKRDIRESLPDRIDLGKPKADPANP